MYNVTMSKVLGGERIRTDIVEGSCLDYPIIGESFVILAESLAFVGGTRIVTTSRVQSITEQVDSLIIKTLNSTYEIIFTET